MSGTAAVAATATATSTPGGDLGQRRTSEALLKLRALKSQFGRKPESDDAAAKAKEVWFKHSDAEGNTYFFCRAKNKSQWTEPTGPNVEIREYKKRASEGEKDERSAAAAASPSARSSSSSSPSAATAATAAAAAAAVTSRDKAEHSESSPESDNDSQLSDASVVSDVWYKNEDPAKGVYFFNRFLNKSQWSHPGPGAMVRKFEPVDSASEDESVDASETGVLDEADDASETISSSASPSPRRRSMRSSSRSPRHSLPHPDFARPTQSTTLVSSDDESSLTANPQAAGQPIASHPAPGKYTVDLSSVSDLSTGIDDRPAEMLIMATPKAHINTAQAKKDAQQSLQKSPTWPLQPVTQPSRDLPVEESLWYRHKDKSGQTYYFNRVTRQSVWEEPTGTGVRILDYVRSQANKWRTATAAVVATRGAKNALKNQIVQAEQRANSAPQTSSVDSSGGPGSPAAMPATPKGHSGGPGSPAAMPATPKGHSGGPGSPAAMPATPKGQKSENRMPGSPSLKQKPPRESFPAVQTQDSVTDLDQIDENSDGESDDSDLDADDQAGGLVASGAVPLTTGPGTQGAIPATPRATGTDATGMRGLSSIPPLSTGPGTIGTIPRTPRRTQSELTGMAVPNMVGAPPLGLSPSSAVKGLPGAPPLVSPDGALANARVSSSGLDTPPFPTTPVGSRHSSSVDLRAQLAARVEQENRKGQEQARLVDNEAGGTDGARRTSHHGKTSSLVDSVFDAMELTDGDDDDDESDGHEDDSDGQHSPSMRPEQAKQPRSSDGARVRNLIMSRALGGNNSPMRGMDSVPTQVTESSSEEPNSDTSLNSPRLSPLPVDDGAPSTPDANGLIDLAGDTPFLKGRAADAPNNLAAALSSKVYGRSARQPRVEGEFGDSNRTTELLSVSFPENNDADDYESENSSGGESSPDVTAHLAAAQSAGGPPLTLSPLVTRNHISDSEDTVDNESEDEMADELSPLAARGAPRKDEFGVGSSRPTHVAPRQNKRMSIVTLKKRRTQSVKEESLRVGNKAMVAATDARLKRARMLATKLRVRARFALATSTDELDQRLAIVLWVQAAWRYRTMKTLNARQQKKRGVLEDRWLSRIGSGRAPPAKSQPGPTRQHRPRRGKSKAIQEQTEPEAELELQPEQEQEKEKEKEQEQVQEQEIEPEQFVGADAKSDSDDASISDDGTEDMLDAMANNAADESDDSLSDAEEPYMQDVSSDEGSSDQDLRPEQLSDHGKVEDEMLATIDAPVGTPSKPARMSRRMTLGEVVMDDVGLSPTNRKVSIETDSFLNDIKFHLGQRVRVLASYCQHHDAGAGVLNDAEEALLENARGNRAGVSGDEDFCEGIIRYSGEVDFASGQWFGVELLRPWGKNDGKVGNTRYFQCAGDRGIFLRPRAVIKSLVAYFVDHIDGLEYYKRLSAQMAESAAVAAAKKLEEQARIEAEREEMRRAAAEAALLAERRREADEALARLRDEQEKLQHAKKLADAEAAQAAELAAQREQAKTIAETDAQAPAPAPTEQASDSEAESQQDMSSGALKEFLLRCGLDQYIPRFVEQGYDDVGFLCSIAHEYPSLQKHIGADSEFANVTLNDLGLKKGHARQLLASLLGSTFDADSQKLVAKPASTDSAVSAWNSIIEADAPDDSSEEDHDAGHINESNMADEPDQSLSPIRSRPSPSPFKGVDSPLQSFLEPTEGSVEIAGERESESTFDEAPTLDDTKLHESSVAAEPSDTAAPSERAQPDSALRAAAELQRYCEQTAPTGMPAPDFQEAVFTVLKALHDQGKNVRNFEPWWKLLNYCYPQIKAQSLPEVGGGILIGVHEFTRGPHERQKSAGEFLEVLCDTLDEEGTFIPESVAAEILEACVTPEQLIQTWDAHGPSSDEHRAMPESVFQDLVQVILACMGVYEEAEAQRLEDEAEAARFAAAEAASFDEDGSFGPASMDEKTDRSEPDERLARQSAAREWVSADQSVQNIHQQLMHDGIISKYASERTRYGPTHTPRDNTRLQRSVSPSTIHQQSFEPSAGEQSHGSSDDEPERNSQNSGTLDEENIDPGLRRRIQKLRSALADFKANALDAEGRPIKSDDTLLTVTEFYVCLRECGEKISKKEATIMCRTVAGYSRLRGNFQPPPRKRVTRGEDGTLLDAADLEPLIDYEDFLSFLAGTKRLAIASPFQKGIRNSGHPSNSTAPPQPRLRNPPQLGNKTNRLSYGIAVSGLPTDAPGPRIGVDQMSFVHPSLSTLNDMRPVATERLADRNTPGVAFIGHLPANSQRRNVRKDSQSAAGTDDLVTSARKLWSEVSDRESTMKSEYGRPEIGFRAGTGTPDSLIFSGSDNARPPLQLGASGPREEFEPQPYHRDHLLDDQRQSTMVDSTHLHNHGTARSPEQSYLGLRWPE